MCKWRGYFLAGVFLDDNVPDGTPPEKLVFTEPFDFPSLEPNIGQVFLIGDGVTTNRSAARVCDSDRRRRGCILGFAMGRLFTGDPGYYWEASDSYTATVNIGAVRRHLRCTYALSETARRCRRRGHGERDGNHGGRVRWTAVSGAAWITVTTGATGSGSGTVGYSVAANTGAARTGTLDDRGADPYVSQAAGTTACTYSINPTTQAVPAAAGR